MGFARFRQRPTAAVAAKNAQRNPSLTPPPPLPSMANRDLCVDFRGECKHIPSNRRYLLMSIVSLWVGMALSFVVAVVSARIVITTYDAGAVAKAEEKQKMKKAVSMAKEPAVPFGV